MSDETQINEGVTPDSNDAANTDVTSSAAPTADVPNAGQPDTSGDVAAFDQAEKDRLLNTITNQREAERQAKAQAKEAAAELEKLRKAVATFEREKMTEEEKRDADFKALSERAQALEAEATQAKAEARETAINSALLSALAKPDAGIVDPEGALILLNRSKLEYDDNGNLTTDSITAAIDALKAEKPYLVVQRRASVGDPTNPQRTTRPPEMNDDQRRRHINNDSGTNPFDPDWARQHQGGVDWSNLVDDVG